LDLLFYFYEIKKKERHIFKQTRRGSKARGQPEGKKGK
jgi:hypothetical protein